MIKSRTCEWKQPQIVRVCIPKSLIAPLIPVVYEVFRLQCFNRSLCALTVALCGCFCFSGRQFRDSVRFRRRGQSSDRGPFYRSPSGRRQKVMKTQLNVKAGKKVFILEITSRLGLFSLTFNLPLIMDTNLKTKMCICLFAHLASPPHMWLHQELFVSPE